MKIYKPWDSGESQSLNLQNLGHTDAQKFLGYGALSLNGHEILLTNGQLLKLAKMYWVLTNG